MRSFRHLHTRSVGRIKLGPARTMPTVFQKAALAWLLLQVRSSNVVRRFPFVTGTWEVLRPVSGRGCDPIRWPENDSKPSTRTIGNVLWRGEPRLPSCAAPGARRIPESDPLRPRARSLAG